MVIRGAPVQRLNLATVAVTSINGLLGPITLDGGHAVNVTTNSGTNTITVAFNGGLDDLSDVDLSGVVTGDVLLKGPGSWINYPLGTITSAFVPYTGAAFDVNLGTHTLTAATLQTDTVIAENLYFNSVPFNSLVCTSPTSGLLTAVTIGTNLSFSAGTLAVTNAALTRTNDTNVTLTLGGSPNSALLAATSLTLGWTGTLAAARGGTGASTQVTNAICYYDGSKITTSSNATLSFIAGDVDLLITHPSVAGTAYEIVVTSSSCQYVMAYNTASTFQGICGTGATENYWTLSTAGLGLYVSASSLWFGSTSNNDLSFYRNNTERLKLTSSGVYIPNALSVGTTTTSRTVQIGTPTATGSLAGNRFVLSDFTASTLELYQSTAENQWRSNLAIGLSANNSATSQLYISTGGLVSITGTISDSVSRFEVFDTNNLGITINAPTPRYNMYESDAALNEKWWDVLAISGTLSYRVVNDAQSSAATFMQVDRTGITIDSVAFPGGKVGIGTTSPSTLLTVAAGTEATDYGKCIQTVRPAASALHMAMIREGTYKWGIGYLYNTNTFGIFNSLSSTDASNTSAALAINSSGNLGVNVVPTAKLHVVKALYETPSLTFGSDCATIIRGESAELACGFGYPSCAGMYLQARYSTNTSLPLFLNPVGGNVAIATNDTSRRLVVAGVGAVNDKLLYLRQTNDYGYSFNLDSTSSGRLYLYGVNAGVETSAIMTFDRTNTYVGVNVSPSFRFHVNENQSYSSRNANPLPAQLVVQSGATGFLKIGNYYTGGVGTCSAIQSTDLFSGADHGVNLLLNPLGGNVGIGEDAPNFTLVARYTSTNPQISARYDGTSPSNYKELHLAYNGATGSGYGWIQALHNGTAYTPLCLNPYGGNVGIGTTNPGSKLQVTADANIGSNWKNAQLRIGGSTNSNYQLNLGYDTTNNLGVIQSGEDGTAYKNLALNPNGGNVGIGTTGPTTKLNIKESGTNNAVVFIEPGTWAPGYYAEIRFGDANHYIRGEWGAGINIYDVNRIALTGSNVGIGTTTPANLLTLANNNYIAWRNGANSGETVGITSTSSDDMQFYVTATQLTITSGGNVVIGNQNALATNATNGFMYIRTCAGTPTGTPTAYTGHVAMLFDTTNSKLYCYNGAWKSVTLT